MNNNILKIYQIDLLLGFLIMEELFYKLNLIIMLLRYSWLTVTIEFILDYQLLILLHFQRYQFKEAKVSLLISEIKPED